MVELTQKELIHVLESGERVLLDFYTPSCGGCKVLAHQLEAVDTDTPIIKVNAESHTDVAMRFGVMKVPQLIIVADNAEEKRHMGFLPTEQIVEFIKEGSAHE